MANYIVKEHNGSDGADSRTKSTIAVWVKRSRTGTEENIWSWGENNSSDSRLKFQSDDTLRFHSDGTGGGATTHITTSQKFRDLNGWYHFVVALDGSNGTEAYRRRIWINGVEFVHGVGSNTFSAAVMGHNSTQDLFIGDNARLQQNAGNAKPFIGYMSHFHYCDGYAYAASDFGEFDATTGEWKAKTSPSVTYGTHGIFLKMENASNMDLDSSPNASSQLSTTGTILPSKDCPGDIFCTLNPLDTSDAITFNLSNANLTMGDVGGDDDHGIRGTLGASAGKYYWEVHAVNAGEVLAVAKSTERLTQSRTDSTPAPGFWGCQSNGSGANVNSYDNGTFSNTNALQGYDSGDKVGIALDMDNGKMFISFNGVWKGRDNNTSDPAAGTNPWFTTIPTDGTIIMPFTEHRSSGNPASHFNFGNGFFGTTEIASEGTNASNIGRFEYDVPTGFTALSTKGLNS